MFVCIGVLVLRYTKPDAHRPFRVPWAPVTCVVGAVGCVVLMKALGDKVWWRLLWWTLIGIALYMVYGYKHSRLRKR